MKKRLRRALGCAFAAALVMTASAAAADISVRVDDQPVVFADAAPVIQDGRTFVPFRAIFEQMGAAVSWDNETRTVIAERNGRVVRLPIGENVVEITENGETRTLTTDAAAFIENERTLVPVRFAAQAFGACVDWESATSTVLIVDVEKLLAPYADTYSIMDNYLAFAAPASARSMNGSLTVQLTLHTAMGDVPVNMTGMINGAEDSRAAQMSGTISVDTAALSAAIEANEGNVIDDEITALLNKLSGQNYEMILSRVDGALYLKSELLTELGAPSGSWVSLPLDSLSGSAASEMLTAVSNGSFLDMVAAKAQSTTLRDTPNATVEKVRAVLEDYADLYGDENFVSSGDTMRLTETGDFGETTLALRYSTEGQVIDAQVTGTAKADGATCIVTATQQQSSLAVNITLTGGKTMDLVCDLKLVFAQGDKEPSVRPSGEVIPVSF